MEKIKIKVEYQKIQQNPNDMSFNYVQTDFKFKEQSSA